ncbi:MAG: molybdopterin-dependent oxidoreductase [Nanoarchaeota archaeon]|nr:molybdopterin-dependent oxidoreductase [Nanoarchaeota archaeon]
MSQLTRTVCPYCGVGCSFDLVVDNSKVTGVQPWKDDPVSEGMPCIKGLKSYQIIYAKDRLKHPMIRKKGRLVKASWDEAYREIYKNLKGLKPREVAFYAASPAPNEACYLFQKIARDIFGTDNVDSCARLCHASTCYALYRAFGITAMDAKIEDIAKSDCILVIGTNPKVTYPVAFNKILKAKRDNNAKLICIRDWRDETSKFADVYVEIKPGLELAFLNAVLHILVRDGKVEVPDEINRVIEDYHADKVAKICSTVKNCFFTVEDIEMVARLVGESKRFVLMHGMGLTQHAYGAHNVFAALNLVIAKNGKNIPMRGKANIQGVGDMGCLPKKGGETISASVFLEPVKALYVMQSNPAQSLPDLNRAHKAMKKMFLVLQATYPSKTMEFANVVLPACSWAEQNGTFTSAESRIRMVTKAVEPLHSSKPDWVVLNDLAKYLGKDYGYNSFEDILKEVKRELPAYGKIDIDNLKNHGSEFAYRPVIFRKFNPVKFTGFEDPTSDEYPLVLTTWRWAFQFCTGDMSRRSETLEKLSPEPLCYVSVEDAKQYKLKDNDKIKITSKVGDVVIKVKVNDDVPQGLLVAPFHFEECLVNKLMPLAYGPVVEEPNLKRVAVNIKKVR